MAAKFDVTVVNRNGRAVTFLRGEIDPTTKELVLEALQTAQQGSADVIVDVSQVTFMDSTGINALVRAYGEAQEGRFHVVGPTKAIRRIFEITGVDGLLLEGSRRLTWQQITHHPSGWRQWTTDQSTRGGAPMGEIIEIGPLAGFGPDGARYLLEMDGHAAVYESLTEAMRAADDPTAQVRGAGGREHLTREQSLNS
jgi:anti-sigma B factor antagonist